MAVTVQGLIAEENEYVWVDVQHEKAISTFEASADATLT